MRIWFDTEFIDDGRTVDLISIGMAREDGATYYAESSECDHSRACEWVQKNVITHLCGPRKTRAAIRAEVVQFCGASPQFWAYFASYDWLVLCQLFGRMLDVPNHWPNFCMDVQQERIRLRVRDLPKQDTVEHNALNDALWTRTAWEYLRHVSSKP